MRNFKLINLIGLTFLALLTACDPEEVGLGSGSEILVCNPFDDAIESGGADQGLIGKLWYVPDVHNSYTKAREFAKNGISVPAKLYFNRLDVPTRPFDQGFVSKNGASLQTPKGEMIYEYFGVHFDSVIRLADHQEEGRYQFAILADDGAVLSINDKGSTFRPLIDIDGLHSSKLGCAAEGVTLTRSSRLPIQVDYFQGPHPHIALMLLWRRLPTANSSLSDDACGVSGNDVFFDSTQTPSSPMQTWIDMQERGWNVVDDENFLLPAKAGTNPCVKGGAATR